MSLDYNHPCGAANQLGRCSPSKDAVASKRSTSLKFDVLAPGDNDTLSRRMQSPGVGFSLIATRVATHPSDIGASGIHHQRRQGTHCKHLCSPSYHHLFLRYHKSGAELNAIKGGITGGYILTGVLRLGQEVEIHLYTQCWNRCKPIFRKIVSLHAENNHLQFAVPGGLFSVGTKIDPMLCRADRLVGQILGAAEGLHR